MVFALYTSRKVPHIAESSLRTLSNLGEPSGNDLMRIPKIQVFSDKAEFIKVLVCRKSYCSNIAMVDIETSEDAAVARFAATVLCADPNVLITFSEQSDETTEPKIPGSDHLNFRRDALVLYSQDASYGFPKASFRKEHDTSPYSSVSLVARTVCPWVACLESSLVEKIQSRLDICERWRRNMAQYRYDALCSGLWPPIPRDEFEWAFPLDGITLEEIVTPEKLDKMNEALGRFHDWDPFSYNEDELLIAAFLMIRNVLGDKAEGGEVKFFDRTIVINNKFEETLLWLLLVFRCCYCSNHYHNFRHIVDVMQAAYVMITSKTACYPSGKPLEVGDKLITLLAGLGHDLFHPGIALGTVRHTNCPWPADENSLESYHAKMFCGLASKLAPEIFDPEVIKCVSTMIAATELARHGEFLQVQRDVSCGGKLHWLSQLVKAADISNCARDFNISKKHALSLALEFMEESRVIQIGNLGENKLPIPQIKSAAEWPKLQPLQQHFANSMARPLFETLAGANESYQKFLLALDSTLDKWSNLPTDILGDGEEEPIPAVQSVHA